MDTNASTSDGDGAGTTGGTEGTTGDSVCADSTSSGSSSTTGPGSPDTAVTMARATNSAARSGSSTRNVALASGAYIARMSTSWNATRSRLPVGTCPTSNNIGAASCRATCTPPLALVAPGPRVTRQMPGRPVSLPYAAAIIAAPVSCRAVINRILSRCAYSPSSTGR